MRPCVLKSWLPLSASLAAVAVLLCLMPFSQAWAQVPDAQGDRAERTATLAKVTALRDQVIAKIGAAGFTCPLPPPTIVIEDVPSYGNFQNESNHLRTSDWTVLTPQEKAFFFKIAAAGNDENAVRAFFERAVHQWIFVHELGHWWQNCRGAITGRPPYGVEYGANRFALAYWREQDPKFAASMSAFFGGMLANMPSPVPAGQTVEPYFNANYQELGPSPAYPWFQARMIVTASGEQPAPAFAAVVAGMK